MSDSPQEDQNQMTGSVNNDTENKPTWTGGRYSGKALHFRYLCILLFSGFYLFLLFYFHKYFVNTKLMPEYFWGFLIGIPAFCWIKCFIAGLIHPVKRKIVVKKNEDGTKKAQSVSLIFGAPRLFCLILFTAVFLTAGFYFRKSILDFVMTNFWYYGVIGSVVPVILLLQTFCVQLYRTWTICYELKNDILIQRKGLFYKENNTTLIQQIKDTKVRYNLIDEYINCKTGTVFLYTDDLTDPVLKLEGLKNPEVIKEVLDEKRAEYARKRGIMRFGGDDLVEDGE